MCVRPIRTRVIVNRLFFVTQLPSDVPLRVLAATGDDEYRKPRIGMYEVLELLYADKGMEIGEFHKDASTVGIADLQ